MRVIGMDPGPTTGIGVILHGPALRFYQCDHNSAIPLLAWLISQTAPGERVVITHERFVVGLRASRVAHAGASEITRDLNGAVGEVVRSQAGDNVTVIEHRAADWKPWATQERLTAAGVLALTKGSGHARDGLSIALYTAVHHCDLRDPLSRRDQSPTWTEPLPPPLDFANAEAAVLAGHQERLATGKTETLRAFYGAQGGHPRVLPGSPTDRMQIAHPPDTQTIRPRGTTPPVGDVSQR